MAVYYAKFFPTLPRASTPVPGLSEWWGAGCFVGERSGSGSFLILVAPRFSIFIIDTRAMKKVKTLPIHLPFIHGNIFLSRPQKGRGDCSLDLIRSAYSTCLGIRNPSRTSRGPILLVFFNISSAADLLPAPLHKIGFSARTFAFFRLFGTQE